MSSCRLLISGAAALVLVAHISPTTVKAQSTADFYKGRQINFLISHPPGGGYDTYARFFVRHLGRLLPGNPNVVPQNMPGAAGVAMTNYMFSQAPKDGSVIGLGPGPLATAALIGTGGARYDARKLSWIGSMNAEVATAVAWHTQPVKTAKDLETKELVVAASGVNDISAIAPTALATLVGLKIKVVTGYKGSAGQMLAMERGEVGGIGGYNYGTLKSTRPKWLSDKLVNILLQYSFEPHPELSSVPTLPQLAKTEDQKQILALIFKPQQMGRPIFGPPGIPADRLALLRAAFDAFVKDKAVLAEAEKTNTELFKPMRGEDMGKLVAELHTSSPEIVQKAAAAMLPADALKASGGQKK